MEILKLTIIIVVVFCLLVGPFIWFFMKQSEKDWNTLRELQEKAYKISTKTELVEFHKEFVEKAYKINNNLIYPELHGYIVGLYKTLK